MSGTMPEMNFVQLSCNYSDSVSKNEKKQKNKKKKANCTILQLFSLVINSMNVLQLCLIRSPAFLSIKNHIVSNE